MAKYRIKPNPPYAYAFTVYADSEEEAIDKAIEDYHNHLSWDGCDIELIEEKEDNE